MPDYIIPKENYDDSLTEIPLGQIFKLQDNLFPYDILLKLKVTSVRPLDSNKATDSDITIPAELKVSGTSEAIAKILSRKYIKTNKSAVVNLEITAFAQGFLDSPLRTKTITVVIGNSTTKRKQKHKEALDAKDQQISELRENQKQALDARDQQISALKQNQKQALTDKDQQINELQQNQKQALATKDQQIGTLQQNLSELKQNQEQAQWALKEAKDIRKSVTKIYAEALQGVSDKASFDKAIDSKLKGQHWKVYHNTCDKLRDIIDDKTSQLELVKGYDDFRIEKYLGELNTAMRYTLDKYAQNDKKIYKTFKPYLNKLFETHEKARNHLVETDKSYSVVFNYTKSFDTDLSFLDKYTIDPTARITVKKDPPVIDKATNVMAFIDLPETTVGVIYCDHTPGKNTASMSKGKDGWHYSAERFHTVDLNQFKENYLAPAEDKWSLPKKTDTANMFTIAAKLKNGNITMPETFLSRTPALAGGK